jgi:SAM-dependent methyltransferase
MLRDRLKRLPLVNGLHRAWINVRFPGSTTYWDTRYRQGGTSGDGSYGELAAFKAEVLNGFIADHKIDSVLELGCGDGNQLALAAYPRYVGLDVSPEAVGRCIERFRRDPTKSFFLYSPRYFHDATGVFAADCTLSLDVIYHLVEDEVYATYLEHLFGWARRFVVIYSSDRSMDGSLVLRDAPHVRHRPVTADVARLFPMFTLVRRIPNRYPERTFASFCVFERTR